MIALTFRWASTFDSKKTLRGTARALKRAGSEAIRGMRAEANRQIRSKKRFKVAFLNKAMKLNYPQGSEISELAWRMDVSGAAVPLSAFTVKQTASGVTAMLGPGKTTKLKSAFLATMDSGHTGVFFRTSKSRLPIDQAFTTGPAAVIQAPGILEAVQDRAGAVFNTAFARLIKLELS